MKIPGYTETPAPRVEMLPLIDVVFLVLVAFVYASMFLTHKTGLPVSLPEANQIESPSLDVLTLTITRDGSLYLGDAALPLTDLGHTLEATRIRNPRATLIVSADREADVGRLVEVMDAARLAGIKALTIQARPKPDIAADQ